MKFVTKYSHQGQTFNLCAECCVKRQNFSHFTVTRRMFLGICAQCKDKV
jgi:hypothetical protein